MIPLIFSLGGLTRIPWTRPKGSTSWWWARPHDNTKFLRVLVDDSLHAVVRTQQIVTGSLARDVFTADLEEAVIGIHPGNIMNTDYHPRFYGAILA